MSHHPPTTHRASSESPTSTSILIATGDKNTYLVFLVNLAHLDYPFHLLYLFHSAQLLSPVIQAHHVYLNAHIIVHMITHLIVHLISLTQSSSSFSSS